MQPDEKTITKLESKVVYTCSLLAGIATILAAVIRGVSVNNFIIASSTNDISKPYSAAAIISWSLSSCMMLLVGTWILFLSAQLKKLQRRAWWQAIIISFVFILFGSGFWYRYPKSIHLPAFILLGLILFIPLILFSSKFKSAK